MRVRAFHQVNHFRLKKMADARIHMKAQAGSRLWQTIAPTGNTKSGTQPAHERRKAPTDSIWLVS